ncbi:MAG: hypothetical protein VKK03_00595 [Synechococcus sp.]|nr:hypothetical protein [Synechococcus sp.]
MVHSRLQPAFEALMQRAPSALFQKARALYLCKYPLDGRDCNSALRLFVAEETIDEQIVSGGSEGERLVTLSIKPLELALVHWQQSAPANDEDVNNYFQQTWGMEAPPCTPQAEPWFRQGGHQSRFNAPEGLLWLRSSPMPEGLDGA